MTDLGQPSPILLINYTENISPWTFTHQAAVYLIKIMWRPQIHETYM